MKKILIFGIVPFILLLFIFSACDKEDVTEGKASYSLAYKDVKSNGTEDLAVFTQIEAEFRSQLSSMTGVEIEEQFYVLHGKFTTCDLAVKKACERAEAEVYNMPMEGHVTFFVTAIYDKTDKKKEIYSHTFGTK